MDGLAILALRQKERLSQTDFAQKLGISQSLISMVECGKKPVSAKIRIRIAQIFGLDDAETIEAIRRGKQSDKLII